MIKLAHKAFLHTLSKGLWGTCVIALYLVAVAFPPATFWLSVKSVHVDDAERGQPPVMEVVRTIRRPFEAKWRVQLEREVADGRFLFLRSVSGENQYGPQAVLPEPLTLDWWTHPQRWRPMPGHYRIETCWTIRVPGLFDRMTCAVSNTFEVKQ